MSVISNPETQLSINLLVNMLSISVFDVFPNLVGRWIRGKKIIEHVI